MDWREMTTSELIGHLTPTPRHCDLVTSYEMLFEIDRRRRGDTAPPPAAPSGHHHTHDATAGIDEPSLQDEDDNDDEDEDDDDDEEDLDEEDFEDGGRGGMMDYREAYRDGGFGGVPASAAAIADLIKKLKYHETGGGDDDATHREAARGCMICIEEFEADDELGVMPCSHMFHHGCLAEWLSRSHLCPCCRHALPSEEQH